MLGKVYNLEITFGERRLRKRARDRRRSSELPAGPREIASATEAVLD